MSIDVEARQVRVSEILGSSASVGSSVAVRGLEARGVEHYATADRAAARIEDSVRGGLANLAFGLVFDVKRTEQGGYAVALTVTRRVPRVAQNAVASLLQGITPDVPVVTRFDR